MGEQFRSAALRRQARACATLVTVLAVFGSASLARAQGLPPIDDRGYAIDLYQGVVIGSSEIIGQGGAGVAGSEGSVGVLFNPATAAIRPTTTNSSLRATLHLDWLNAGRKDDLENSGLPHDDASSLLLTGGLSITYKAWSLALTGTTFSFAKRDDAATEVRLQNAKLAVARMVARDTIALGVAVRTGTLGIDAGGETLFETSSQALELGSVWLPTGRAYRLGAAMSLPVRRGRVEASSCDPMDCMGYILPEEVALPPTLRLGAAYRFGPTPWNTRVAAKYRDERHYTVAADVLLTAPARQGAGLGAFLEQKLQRSGQHTTVNINVGANAEIMPGRLRVRAGSYWEAARLENRHGRVHGTAGADWRLFAMRLWSWRFRVRLTATVDVASRYVNSGISLGFWN